MRVHGRGDRGFSLPEMLVATLVALVLFTGLLGLLNPMTHSARAQPERVDVQQRIRAGSRTLLGDFRRAGAGLTVGPAAAPLIRFFAPVLPRRLGAVAPDPPAVARADAVTLLWTPLDAPETTLASPLAGTTATLAPSAGCAPARPACGFVAGASVVLFDGTGQFDLFLVTSVVGSDIQLRSLGAAPSLAYGAGTFVAEVIARTYYFDAAARHLHQYDTDVTDVVILDDITRFEIEYFGTAAPVGMPRPTLGTPNCLYDAAGVRLPDVALQSDSNGLAPLPLAILRDGPWCGTGSAAFDADVLRIRRVRLTLEAQASSSVLRGVGTGFATAGSSTTAWRWQPDLVVSVDVAPPNLNLE